MRWVLVSALALLMTCSIMAQAKFTPREIDDLLPNPDIGWETFHVPAKYDKSLPKWLPSTVYYRRWGWAAVEPTHGDYQFAAIEKELAAAEESGQTLAFRIMSCSSGPKEPYHPKWIKDIGGRVVQTDYDGVALEVPDLDDPKVLDAHLALIRALGQKYDGDPRISHVDLGSVGWWGEWHMSGSKTAQMPRPETCRKIVDAYLAAFTKTPLTMLIGGGEQTAYACAQGTGWRADCLGDLGGFSKTWCHMRKGYPEWFRTAKLDDAWKRGPIAYESCWDMRKWKSENWPLRFIFNYALATHASVINNKSAPLPDGDDVRPEVERFVKRLGYRIVLREVTVTPSAGRIQISSAWQNVGSAPLYRPAHVGWQLRPAKDNASQPQFPSKLAARDLMPGQVDVFTPEFIENPPELPLGPTVTVADDSQDILSGAIPSGEYDLRVAMWYGDYNGPFPMVRLANEGRGADGWYTLGKVRIP